MPKKDIGLTAEQYKAVVAIVDERMKEIRVTREDFDELRAIVKQLAKAQARTEIALRNLAVQVGRLTDTIGYGLEDIARVVLPGYLERHYNVKVEKLERRFFKLKGRVIESNLYGEGLRDGEKVIVVGEAKSKIYEKDVKSFTKNIARLNKQFDAEVLKIMFGYFVHPSASKLAKEEKIILVA